MGVIGEDRVGAGELWIWGKSADVIDEETLARRQEMGKHEADGLGENRRAQGPGGQKKCWRRDVTRAE